MKTRIITSITTLLLLLFFPACSSSIDNSITFKNLASGSILVNFRGEDISVPAGETVIVKEIPKGSYSYSTTYESPAGAQSSSEEGETSGTLSLDAGTKVLILYSSTYSNNVYTLYATMSSNDNLNDDGEGVLP